MLRRGTKERVSTRLNLNSMKNLHKEEPKYTTSNLDNDKYKDYSVAKERAKNYMSLKGALEPKQIKCYCGHTTYCDCSPLEEPKDVVLGYKTSLDAQMLDRIEPKQETLEEAAENFVNSTRLRNYKVLFIEGAKWQQERMYSEEDLISFAHFYFQEEFNSTMQTSKSTDEIFKEWFEQFKKK